MNKRGQVYFLAALLLAVVIFGLLIRLNSVNKLFFEDDFEELSENYRRESNVFLNELTQKKLQDVNFDTDNLLNGFLGFTVDFSTYSKTQNPDFGLIYLFDVFNGTNKLFIGNYLDQDIIAFINGNFGEASALVGCRSVIRAGAGFDGIGFTEGIPLSDISRCNATIDTGMIGDYNVSFVIGEVQYDTDVVSGIPEIVIVSQEFKNKQRKVFLSDNFISGGKIDIIVFCSDTDLSAGAVDSEVCSCTKRNTEEKCEELNSLECFWNSTGNCEDA